MLQARGLGIKRGKERGPMQSRLEKEERMKRGGGIMGLGKRTDYIMNLLKKGSNFNTRRKKAALCPHHLPSSKARGDERGPKRNGVRNFIREGIHAPSSLVCS